MSADPHLPQIAAEHYWSRAYNTKERFASFWHQIDETLELEPKSVLEVGPGAGPVSSSLRQSGLDLKTLDIDDALSPDLLGSVTQIPLPDDAVDVVLAAEVLEHLPFDEVAQALTEIGRVARVGAVISVPDVRPYVGFAYPLYFGMYAEDVRRGQPGSRWALLRRLLMRQVRVRDYLFTRVVPGRWATGDRVWEPSFPIPHRPWKHEFDGQHYWELGTEGCPPERLTAAMSAAGLAVTKDFRVPEFPWHHFFVVRPERIAP